MSNLFGDLFGQRADYSDGMFYAGHRRYLNPSNKSGLEPPNEFKTKRQFRASKRAETEVKSDNAIEKMSFHINFQKKHEGIEDSVDLLNKKFKKVATIVKTKLILEHFSSLSRNDWIEDTQAGCHIWINKNTGEVVSVCPWQVHVDDQQQNQLSLMNTGRDSLSTLDHDGSVTNTGGVGGGSNSNIRTQLIHGGGSTHSISDSTPRRPLNHSATAPRHNILSSAASSVMQHSNSHNSSHIHSSHQTPRSARSQGLQSIADEETECGTGSLVYDGRELDELFATLDRMGSKDTEKINKK